MMIVVGDVYPEDSSEMRYIAAVSYIGIRTKELVLNTKEID